MLDQLALIALRKGDVDGARSFYSTILRRQPFDAPALYGLGRVSLEKEEYEAAMELWLSALRIRALGKTLDNRRFARLTARSVIGLCSVASEVRPLGGQRIRQAIHRSFLEEDARVATLLVDAIASLAAVAEWDLPTVLAPLSERVERRIVQRTAQLLMVHTIHQTLGLIESVEPGREQAIEESIAWCNERDVLAEYLAGGKFAYERALLRARLGGLRTPSGLINEAPSSRKALKRLFDHVRSFDYSPDYYSRAYRLVRNAGRLEPRELVPYVDALVRATAASVSSAAPQPAALHERLALAPATWTLSQFIPVESEASKVSATVDRDSVSAVHAILGAGMWRTSAAGTAIERSIPQERESVVSRFSSPGLSVQRGPQAVVVSIDLIGDEYSDIGEDEGDEPAVA